LAFCPKPGELGCDAVRRARNGLSDDSRLLAAGLAGPRENTLLIVHLTELSLSKCAAETGFDCTAGRIIAPRYR
jgi:hypothetical protein